MRYSKMMKIGMMAFPQRRRTLKVSPDIREKARDIPYRVRKFHPDTMTHSFQCSTALARFVLMALLCLACSWGHFSAQDVGAPPAGPESLRLPEVVITGIDRSKIQRMIPKVDLRPEWHIPAATARDRAETLLRQGDAAFDRQPAQALERYEQAIQADPAYAAAYQRLGEAYRSQGRSVDAVQAYQRALEIQSAWPDVLYQVGVLYEEQLQNAEQAVEHYQAYLDAGGADPRVAIWIRNLRRQLSPTAPEPASDSPSS